ncbi:hypothetical protein C450_05855 [Halococcus salifodinae DSM 8989]|uniref:Uncharacterized protein n=1 Tax=Halococcus salifodinae DSM 8989 TaxID=1227456 RepID=M0N9M2_9EURY|nr:hypothetical protein C450_05855 [Halococcus salifodinae DSM 8989]
MPLTQSIPKPVAISRSTNETVSTDDAKLLRGLESGWQNIAVSNFVKSTSMGTGTCGSNSMPVSDIARKAFSRRLNHQIGLGDARHHEESMDQAQPGGGGKTCATDQPFPRRHRVQRSLSAKSQELAHVPG